MIIVMNLPCHLHNKFITMALQEWPGLKSLLDRSSDRSFFQYCDIHSSETDK